MSVSNTSRVSSLGSLLLGGGTLENGNSGEGKGSGSELCLLSNSIIWGAFTFEPPPALGSLSQSASFPVHTIKNV